MEMDESPSFETPPMTIPVINWFGSMIMTRELLIWTKGNLEDGDNDSFIRKMNKQNFIGRVDALLTAVHSNSGFTVEAAEWLQNCYQDKNGNTSGFFTDVSAQALADKMNEIAEEMKTGKIFKFRTNEFGALTYPENSENS